MPSIKKASPEVKMALISAAAAILAALISGVFLLIPRVQQSVSTNIPNTPTIISSTITPSPNIAYDFETGTQYWMSPEGDFKEVIVDVTTNPVHSGKQALKVTSTILGDASPAFTRDKAVYLHTAAEVYFNSGTPNGFDNTGPYNLKGKLISCYVYLPSGLSTGGKNSAYIRIFVSDIKFANDFSTYINIDQSKVDHWIKLSLIVGTDTNNADLNFDPTKVIAMGIRIETPAGSTLNYSGPFYVDDCAIQH